MPVREDLISGGSLADGSVTNGAYTAASLSSREVELTRSETYYDSAAVGPDVLRFVTVGDSESDYEAYLAGELDLIQDLPASVLQELESTGTWLPEAVTATYAVVLNTQQPPFDDVNVRQAFRLAVDTQALVDALGDLTARAAVGLIPYGVTDYGQHEEAAEEEPAVPDPNAAPVQETPEPQWDFRIHSQELVTLPESGSYEENCRQGPGPHGPGGLRRRRQLPGGGVPLRGVRRRPGRGPGPPVHVAGAAGGDGDRPGREPGGV